MNVRVNLLKDHEIRYYTAVSKAFAIRTGIIGLSLFLTLLSILFILRVMNVKAGLSRNQAEWAELEPRYTKYLSLKENLKVNEGLMKELDDWKQMKVSWNEPLVRMQMLVPENLQFAALDVRSSFGAKIDRNTIGEGEDAQEIVKVAPYRQYAMTLKGLATGDRADETVVNFVRSLRADSQLGALLEKVKLQGLQRGNANEEGSRVFTLEASTYNIGPKS